MTSINPEIAHLKRERRKFTNAFKTQLAFVYDAMGNRVAKNVMTASGAWIETEYYVRDAQGNVMAIYKRSIRNDAMEFELTEQHIYGSTRLGVDRRNVDMIAAATPSDNGAWQVKRGEKHYELSNHLGNVLATVSDKKIAVMNGANLSYYRADVVSYSDYYPFGAPMTERTGVVTPTDVRYGFNGKEIDSEGMGGGLSTYDYGFRIYNPHIAKFLSTDPLSKEYPWYTPYQFAGNKPIIAIDLDGLEEFIRTDYMNAAGNIYRTEIQVVKRTPINGQIVHQCVVSVDNFGNGAINYIGTSYGTTLPGGMGSNLFSPAENALIWNSNLIIANTAIVDPRQGPLVGSLWNFTAPDNSKGDIVTGQMLIPGVRGGPPLFNLLNGVVVGRTAGVSNGDPDYNGILVLQGMGAVPPNEPYTPAGFNNVPANPSQRINITTGFTFAQDIAAGITTNSGGQSLQCKASTPQDCVLSGNNDSTTSDVGFRNSSVINVPSRNAVGTGNAENTVQSGTITITN